MRTYYLTETWSSRKRPDGTLEPDVRISGVGISPVREDDGLLAKVIRQNLTTFSLYPADEPFFIVQAEFKLIEPAHDRH